VLAALAKGQLRKKTRTIAESPGGHAAAPSSIVVVELLSQIDYLDEAIARLDSEIATLMQPFQAELGALDSIPGSKSAYCRSADCRGRGDMTPFASARAWPRWAGMCPGNHESAGRTQVGQRLAGQSMAAPGVNRSGSWCGADEEELSLGPLSPARLANAAADVRLWPWATPF